MTHTTGPRAAGGTLAARVRFASVLALSSALLAAAWAAGATYLEGPPPQHTGGFGEATCHFCHFDYDLNEEGGTLAVDGLPGAFEPGATYRFTVQLRHPELSRAGFQLAIRTSDGKQAGTLRATDDRATVTKGQNGVLYAHHVREGTRPIARGVARWTLEWTAPTAATDVVLHIAANVADANDSESGDRIYTLQKTFGSGE